MNITEANAVQALATWLLDPHADDAGPAAWEAARDGLALLADRSSTTLAAGLRGADVAAGWDTALQGCPGCSACLPGDLWPPVPRLDPNALKDRFGLSTPLIETVQLAPGGPL